MASPQLAKQEPESDDLALVERAKAHDDHAFEELVRRYHSQVYRLALTVTKNPRDAEEVTQETFLNLYRKLDTFRGESKFSSWLYRVTANFALMRLRKQRRQPQVLLDDLLPQFYENSGKNDKPASDWSERADRQFENRELGSKINTAIADLPEKYRIILVLRDVENLSNEEIAQTLGMSVPAVKSILHRSRLFVREALSKYFDGDAGTGGAR
jgi:RNA polymerase sigma-70 factor (ECF subfamily)